ncbi:hypothetical protein P8452_01778 [Trifolium repens]|nr:hypothetical protein P8452_01778 [Trifolium repens]
MLAYGVMLIAALSTLLLIIYNFSDQVLTTRERRVATSREAEAKCKENCKCTPKMEICKRYCKCTPKNQK